MSYALRQMGYETGLNEKVLKQINDFFRPIKEKFLEAGVLNPYVMGTETDALTYQIPGGMLSNLIAQLKQQNSLDKLDEVLQETPRVRKDLGYPPLVTPMSQMVGVQAATNVLMGERYKNVSKEVKAYLKGEYGKAPGQINPELLKKVLGDEEPITNRFADNLEPEFNKAKKKLGSMAESDEDVLSYIAFPQIAEKFFREREERRASTVSYTIVKM
jgi:oxaloacetate decarboxylase alpha subunit